jgi:hypothetical protein
MGAAAVISYSGQTVLHSAGERRGATSGAEEQTLLSRLPLNERDALPWVAACPDLRIWHMACKGNKNDLWHQARLAGLPHARLLTLAGYAHNTVLPAILDGQFDTLLTDAIAETN